MTATDPTSTAQMSTGSAAPNPAVAGATRCPFCEAQPGQAVTATAAQADAHRRHGLQRWCPQPGVTPHRTTAHGSDAPHNPWSVRCSKRLSNEPSCPDAFCWTCDATTEQVPNG